MRQQLLAAYAQPQRKYHTLQHLTECLELLDRYRDLALEPAEIELALWFHDAVYDVKAFDNEVRSAAWAETELGRAGVPPERIERITGHIMSTRHSALPQGQDQMLLLDIDLAILGASRERFAEYQNQIRAEYAWVPEILFQSKRRTVLAEFLARAPIYNTMKLREVLEFQARENLIRALRMPEHD